MSLGKVVCFAGHRYPFIHVLLLLQLASCEKTFDEIAVHLLHSLNKLDFVLQVRDL
jgi:hypothetical protein